MFAYKNRIPLIQLASIKIISISIQVLQFSAFAKTKLSASQSPSHSSVCRVLDFSFSSKSSMEGEGVDVPCYFLCPISLQTMRDPVILSTGITYDRHAIERWIFSEKHTTCPATRQTLTNTDLIPNHTLRRLIQSWCVANASNGIERFPTPRPSVDKARIASLLADAMMPHLRLDSLCKLKSIISESDRNKRCVEASGFLDLLASIIKFESLESEEALTILFNLQISEQGLLHLIERNDDVIESLTLILHRSNYQSRVYATLLLKSLISVLAPERLIGLRHELFQGLVKVLKDGISYQAMKAALQVLSVVCPWGRNRIKAVNVGAVAALIELLMNQQEKRPTEMLLAVLDQLCRCPEGRMELVQHAAGLAAVSKKILRVSEMASERAVRILHSVAQFSTPAVLQEMLQVGAVSKLCLLLQVECGLKMREKVKELLRMNSRVWRNSPCISSQWKALYPF